MQKFESAKNQKKKLSQRNFLGHNFQFNAKIWISKNLDRQETKSQIFYVFEIQLHQQ